MQYMFGSPFYQSKIDASQYNKSEIIGDITENYNKSPFRNKWDKQSNLHHPYKDLNNSEFKKINYEQVIPLYTQEIKKFFDEYSDIPIKFRYDVENYTCMSQGQFMREHDHPFADFSGIHYIKFNPEEHSPTTFINPAHWGLYSDRITSKKHNEVCTGSALKHSWYWYNYKLKVEEDDLVITPAPLKHLVELQTSEELRIAIVLNIYLIDD